MRRFTVILLSLAVILTASAASAGTLNTKYFTFDIPKGWDGFAIDETSVRVYKDGGTASLYIEVNDLEDWTLDELAEFYAKEHSAKDLKKEETNGSYTFSYEEDGKIHVAALNANEKIYVLFISEGTSKEDFDSLAGLKQYIRRK